MQLPQIPLQPAPCVEMALTGIPIATRKLISLFFIMLPPIAYSLHRAAMRTHAADNAIMPAQLRLLLLHRRRLHRAGLGTLAAADALLLIHLHLPGKPQSAAKRIHQALRRADRTEKIAEAATALCEQAKNNEPQKGGKNQAGRQRNKIAARSIVHQQIEQKKVAICAG